MACETAENAMKANFYVVGKEGPTPGYDKGYGSTLEITIEPCFKKVYIIDSLEVKVAVPFNWFFNIKEGER